MVSDGPEEIKTFVEEPSLNKLKYFQQGTVYLI